MALRGDDELDRYLGLVAAGWALAVTVPVASLPIAFLLLERRIGHAIGMLVVSVIEIGLFVLLFTHIS